MTRFVAFLLVGLGVVLLGFGLLFLVGSGGQTSRLVVAAVGLGGGAVLVFVGVVVHRRADALTPDRLRAEILAAAQRGSGVVSAAELRAALGSRWEAGRDQLVALEGDGSCVRSMGASGEQWVFEALQPVQAVRRCTHCDKALPLKLDEGTCPHCGGHVEVAQERVELKGEGLYSMDDA